MVALQHSHRDQACLQAAGKLIIFRLLTSMSILVDQSPFLNGGAAWYPG